MCARDFLRAKIERRKLLDGYVDTEHGAMTVLWARLPGVI